MQEVKEMGDKDYIPWSDRIRNEGWQDGMNQGISQGISQGIKEVIVDLLTELGDIPKEVSEKIQAEEAIDTLKQWHRIAANANSIVEFTQKISNGECFTSK